MKIGILQTGLAPDQIAVKTGDYPEMFERLLAGRGFTFQSWRVVENQFPDGPDDAEGWLITGSKHGVYEDHDWMPPLEALIRNIVAAGRPLVGVCFGHQVIAQALGGHVEKFSGGWSVGPVAYRFPDGERVVQAWHQDQVISPPAGAETVASTDFCKHAALVYPGKAYTVQPHPEFGDDFVKELIETRGRGVVPDELLRAANNRLGSPLDRSLIADQFEHFFKNKVLP